MAADRDAAPSGMRRLRVVIGTLGVGGTERHLLRVLPRLRGLGWESEVVTLTRAGTLAPDFRARGVRVHEPPGASRLGWLPRLLRRVLLLPIALTALARRMRAEPDVLTCFYLPEAYLVGMIAARVAGTRAPLVMSRRSLNAYQRRYPHWAFLERRFHRRVDAIVANSRAIADELRDAEGVPPGRVVLISNGVEPPTLDAAAARTATREALRVPQHALVLVTVANLIGYKGHADLLRALAIADRQLPADWRWLGVGRDTGLGAELQALAVSLGIDGHLAWLGERDDVPALLTAADIGVLPSHEEGSSNAVLESMSAALPMVATRVGGNPEAVLDGETGLLVPAHDPQRLAEAIVALARDRERASAMGRAGRRRVEHVFTLEACVRNYADLFDALHDGGRVPAGLVAAGSQPVTGETCRG